MLEHSLAMAILDGIRDFYSPCTTDISIKDVMRMQPVSLCEEGGYTIYAMQRGDLTILVWIQYNKLNHPVVRAVKTQAW